MARVRRGGIALRRHRRLLATICGFRRIMPRIPKRDFLRSYLLCRIAWSLPLIAHSMSLGDFRGSLSSRKLTHHAPRASQAAYQPAVSCTRPLGTSVSRRSVICRLRRGASQPPQAGHSSIGQQTPLKLHKIHRHDAHLERAHRPPGPSQIARPAAAARGQSGTFVRFIGHLNELKRN